LGTFYVDALRTFTIDADNMNFPNYLRAIFPNIRTFFGLLQLGKVTGLMRHG